VLLGVSVIVVFLSAVPAAPGSPSKKAGMLAEKAGRPAVQVTDKQIRQARARAKRPVPKGTPPRAPAIGVTSPPLTTFYNVWTHEVLTCMPGMPAGQQLDAFLRDRFTNETRPMDARLLDVLLNVATHFEAKRIEILSGYRSPKYNLMLRKKGRSVARTSQHMEGHAVDFRVRGVPVKTLYRYVRSLQKGGVGYYPHSRFVHADFGPVRVWQGS
jgi:hypothetical protein